MQPDSTLKNYDRVVHAYGIKGICVTAAPGQQPADLERHLRSMNRAYVHAPVHELEALGCSVVEEPGHGWPDALLVFPDEPTTEFLGRVREVFEARSQRPNPNSAVR